MFGSPLGPVLGDTDEKEVLLSREVENYLSVKGLL